MKNSEINKSLISIIIPTYNRRHLLNEAVNSVLNQTYNNFELIIVDNHSSDNTEKYCKTLVNNNNKIRYHRNKKNLGMIENWNVGLSLAKGEYVNILMDDDILHHDFLVSTIKILKNNNNIGFVCVKIIPAIIENGETVVQDNTKDAYRLHLFSKKNKSVEGLKKYIFRTLKIGLPSGILFRKQYGIIFDEYGLDPGFWLDYLNKYEYYYYVNKPLCYWRTHEGDAFTKSLSQQKNIKIQYRRMIYNLNKAYNYLLIKDNIDIQTEKKYFIELSKWENELK